MQPGLYFNPLQEALETVRGTAVAGGDILTGRMVAHYQIISKLASGGMGAVYKAFDLRLARRVALKFLPRSLAEDEVARMRFLQEAQTVSALDHPNICTIYEIDETSEGELFLAMAYYEGGTLREMIQSGPLLVREAAGLAAQVAAGLAVAHQSGIVHRDVKPANVALSRGGQVKILDFGIAKLTGTDDEWLAGTTSHMSPEQLAGDKVDHRSDIWSLGVLLYQMLTGEVPFPGEDGDEVLAEIRREAPIPPDVPEPEGSRLAAILARALARDPDERYQDVARMHKDLEDLTAATLQETMPLVTGATIGRHEPAIAVLPLADHSPEKDQEYICSGLAEEIIHLLTQVPGVRVASRSSAFRPTARGEDVRRLGRQLRVDSVLEGSVFKDALRLRVAVRLVRVADGSYLWSGRYDRELAGVFQIQEEIARDIVDALKPTLVETEDAPARLEVSTPPESFPAYLHYLRGRYEWNKRTHAALNRGIAHFEEAILEEPRYARAYAGLADSYAMLGIYGYMPPREVMPLAKRAAEQALAIDDRLAEVYTSRASIRAVYEWDFAGAERDFRHAIALDPTYATAYQWQAMNHLIPTGRFAEAFEALEAAWELDPLSLTIVTSRGLFFYYYRRYQRAVDELRRALEIDDAFEPAHVFLGQVYDKQGRYQEALQELRQASSLSGGRPDITVALGHAHAQLGQDELARCLRDKLLADSLSQYVSPSVLAQVHAALGERDAALEALGRAREMRSADLLWIGVNPAFDSLHEEAAFRCLLEEIGLEVHEPLSPP